MDIEVCLCVELCAGGCGHVAQQNVSMTFASNPLSRYVKWLIQKAGKNIQRLCKFWPDVSNIQKPTRFNKYSKK